MNDDLFTIPPDADPLLRRAAIFVSVGDFSNADAYCERVLDTAPENAFAYMIKAMAKCKAQNVEQLVAVSELTELTEFKLARKFADAEFTAKLDELLRERESAEATRSILKACAARIRTLQELSAMPLPDDLAAKVRQRLGTEEKFMAAPDAAAAEREAAATAELKDRVEKILPIRKACAARIRTLQELSAMPLPDDLAAEVRQRLGAEEKFMAAPDAAAAEREAAASAELKDRIEKILPILKACAARIRMLQELSAMPLPGGLAAELRQRLDAEQSLMGAPAPEAAAEREAAATAALKAKIDIGQNTLRATCSVRIRTLQELSAMSLPDDLAAEVRQRIEAEQALMRAPTLDAAEREADATAALREKLVPRYRRKLTELLPKLEKIAPNQNLPKCDREIASKRCDKIRALLEDPGADLRTLGYELERCRIEFDNLSRELEYSDYRILTIIAFVLILFVAMFIFCAFI